MSDLLLIERHGHVVVLTLNRPDVRNAFNLDLTIALGDALEDADQDPDVRAIVLTGSGTQSFSAGADLKAYARGESNHPSDPVRAAWGFAGVVSHPISTPMIAAVNGAALGGGTEIVLACDLAVASRTATFGLPEVKRGLYAGAGGAFRIGQQVPRKLAMELLLTGDPITAGRALELGLINRVTEPAALMEAALELAGRIAANAPLAVQFSKRLASGIFEGKIPAEEPYWAMGATEGARVLQSEDTKEGALSFVEKRAPVWKGR